MSLRNEKRPNAMLRCVLYVPTWWRSCRFDGVKRRWRREELHVGFQIKGADQTHSGRDRRPIARARNMFFPLTRSNFSVAREREIEIVPNSVTPLSRSVTASALARET